MVPAVFAQHLGRGLGVLVVFLEQPFGLDQDFAVVCHFDLDTADRIAHRVGKYLVVWLDADKHGGFGRSIQLLEIDADGAEEGEQVRPDRLAGGIGHAHPAETHVVAQRAKHHPVAQPVADLVHQAHGLAITQGRAHPFGHFHEVVEHLALDGACIFHTDHHAGQNAFKNARRRKVVGGADLFQVDIDGAARFGAVHHITAGQPLRIAEDVLADPGGRQVGQHLFHAGQVFEFGTCRGAFQ
ncbi:hypothetical protein D3C72_1431450 [compost metagenome]